MHFGCRYLDVSKRPLFDRVWDNAALIDLRKGNARSDVSAIVQGVVVTGHSLRFANLDESELFGADLRGVDLTGATLVRSRLQGVDLREARLRRADLSHAQLQGADLYRAQLQSANLPAVQLQGANLLAAQLQGANLQEAHLEGANLANAELQDATLIYAQLQGADLDEAKLQGVNLSSAHFECANLRLARLQDANLRAAQLQDANLSDAQLQGADLSIAPLQGANLGGAQLQGANLAGAHLWRATGEKDRTRINLVDLRGADVTEAPSALERQEILRWVRRQQRKDEVARLLDPAQPFDAKNPILQASIGSVLVTDKQPFLDAGMPEDRLVTDPREYWKEVKDWLPKSAPGLGDNYKITGWRTVARFAVDRSPRDVETVAGFAAIACHLLDIGEAVPSDLNPMVKDEIASIAGTCRH